MMNARRYLCLSAGFATLASLASSVFFLVSRFNAVGSSGWGQFGGFVSTYVDWQYSPQATEIYFGISFTLFLAFLCIFISLSKLPSRVKAVSVAGTILLVLNAFYIWTSDILYPQSNGLQNYIAGSVMVFVSVVTGNWSEYGLRFVDFGLPILALCVGVCGMALGKKKVDRVIGFFSWASIAVLPLGLECHFTGLGSEATISYFGVSTSPLHLITNDLILYLSGFVLLSCVCVVFLKKASAREQNLGDRG